MRPTVVATTAVAAMLMLTGLIVSPPLPAEAGVNTWDTPTTISPLAQNANAAQVATDGNTITNVWSLFDGSNTRIQASSSVNGGATWSTPVNLSVVGQDATSPQLVTDGSAITAVWARSDGSNTRIQASSSVNRGATWSAPVNLSEVGRNATAPQVVTAGGTVTAVWVRSDGSNNRIQASSSVDVGATWSTPANLSEAGQVAGDPQVTTDGRIITAVWNRFDGSLDRIQTSSSANEGTTWSTPVTLSEAGQFAFSATVVTDGRTITAAWYRYDGSHYRIQASSSVDGGNAWGTPVNLSESGQSADTPQLVTDATRITAVWQRNDGSNNRIQASSSVDRGTTWSAPVYLSETGQNAGRAQLATDGRTITAFWDRVDGTNQRVQTSSSVNGGTSWSAPLTLTAADQFAYEPQLATDGSMVTAVWRLFDGVNDRVQVSSLTSPRQPARLAGGDRYSTGVAISQQFAPNVPVVYLAAGTNFPDALSASSAATLLGGPLLLTTPTALPTVVATELQRLNPARVVIAGGSGVVSEAVRAQVQELLPLAAVRRDSGANRYETSRDLAANAFSDAPLVFVATGSNFPDALSASAAAGAADSPVILIDGSGTDIDQPTRDLFTQLATTKVVIAGGTGAVRPEIQIALSTHFGEANVTRLAGADRYATGVAVNQARFIVAPTVFLATGTGFADALAGAALAGRDKGPLYVVPGACVPPTVISELSRLKVNQVTLFGGTGVLTSAVQTLTPC